MNDHERIRRSRFGMFQILSCQRLYGDNVDDETYRLKCALCRDSLFREYPDEIENVPGYLWTIKVGAIIAHRSADTTKIEVRS